MFKPSLFQHWLCEPAIELRSARCYVCLLCEGGIGLGRVVAIPVECVLRATRNFLQQPVPKSHNIHFQQGMTMVDPFNHRPKAVTAKQPSAMESATLT